MTHVAKSNAHTRDNRKAEVRRVHAGTDIKSFVLKKNEDVQNGQRGSCAYSRSLELDQTRSNMADDGHIIGR